MEQTSKAIDEYIKEQKEEAQVYLNEIRDHIGKLLPDAQEKISWRMPTFWNGANIIHFAAFKNHVGIYPGAEAIKHFEKELLEYKTSKGAVQFEYGKPLPLELIGNIAKWAEENNIKKC